MMVSVVIPTCHRNDSLAQCLGCLAPGTQTLAPSEYEVIVSDDGSQSTAKGMICEQFPWARWVAGPRRGPAANRNNGVQFARGEWIAFTDDDCLPDPQWLSSFLEHETNVSVMEGKTTTQQTRSVFLIAPQNLEGGFLWSCNMAIRKATFLDLGGFDDRFPHPHLGDVELFLRIKKASLSVLFVPEAIVFHPLRPLITIWKQIHSHESAWYMSTKHHIPLREFQLHPVLFWKHQLRQVVKKSKSPLEALRFLLFRSCVEAAFLLFYCRSWNKKYRMWK